MIRESAEAFAWPTMKRKWPTTPRRIIPKTNSPRRKITESTLEADPMMVEMMGKWV